eukprot:TRINITY_DN248_c0_g1_i1.p2 TRINITY_DN248_c0_g1~~TRINITY_DN248_c0_g1_i1.p2  ORF type:complete len:161 (-),score=30.26 TRINITY_DN248_c0_g1_i1:74-535(-)
MSAVKVVVFLCLVAVAVAHVCTFFPPQRGPLYGLNTPASNACFLTTPPCGINNETSPRVVLQAGHEYNITFQKNENHWTVNAGYWAIEIAPHPGAPYHTLAKFADTNSPALTMYTIPVHLPTQPSDHAIIRVHYACNGLPFTFYTCSDVALVR